jgi:hypothetical protein
MIEFPSNAAFGKKIPLVQLKKQGLSPRLADLVKSLVWAYKLSPSTVSLGATEAVKEIEVMDLTLKDACTTARPFAALLSALDTLIPSPLVFRVFDEDGSFREVAFNLKTSGGALTGASEVFRVFRTAEELPLPAGVVNLESFYKLFAAAVGGLTTSPTETVKELDARHYRLESLRADLADVEKKLCKTAQLDIKYQLSKDKQKLQKEIEKCLNSNM